MGLQMDLRKTDRALRPLTPRDRAPAMALGDQISWGLAPSGMKAFELSASSMPSDTRHRRRTCPCNNSPECRYGGLLQSKQLRE